MALNELKKLNKTNCINNLAVGCCLLNHCKCYDNKDFNNLEIFDNGPSGIFARYILSEPDSEEEDRKRHYRLG